MWFNHPWDITTFYNMFANLSQGVSPYAEFEFLSRLSLTSTNHWALFYEGFAYPPGLLYLYYVPAQVLSFLAGPLTPHWLLPAMPYVIPPVEVVNPLFQTLFKTPIFMADIGIGVMLGKLVGRRAMILYLFNPLVVVVSASWTFEALPLFCIVAAYFMLKRRQPVVAGLALGAGTVLKLYPAVLAPVIAIEYLRNRQYKELRAFLLSFVTVVVVGIVPYWGGVQDALRFHAMRKGGGLSLHKLIDVYESLTSGPVLWIQAVLSPGVGAITLIAGLTWFYLWVWRKQPPILNAFIVGIAALLLSSKLVNEQFVVWLIPFLILGIAVSGTTKTTRLYWYTTLLPLAYAAINVPLTGFFYPLGHWRVVAFDVLSRPSELMIGSTAHALLLSAIAVIFVITAAQIVKHYGSSWESR